MDFKDMMKDKPRKQAVKKTERRERVMPPNDIKIPQQAEPKKAEKPKGGLTSAYTDVTDVLVQMEVCAGVSNAAVVGKGMDNAGLTNFYFLNWAMYNTSM